MVDAEYAVIGTLLLSDDMLGGADVSLKPEMFENVMLKEVYRLLISSYDNGRNIGIPVITENLKDNFSEIEIDAGLRKCLDYADTVRFSENVLAVKQSYQYRRLMAVMKGRKPTFGTITEDISGLIGELEAISECEDNNGVKSLSEIAKECKGNYFKKRETPMMHFPFKALDDKVQGLEGGDLIVIGARPAVGKSAFVAQLALNFVKDGKRVGFYSLEMKQKQLYERFSALSSGLTMDKIRTAEQFESEQERQLFDDGNSFLEQKTTLFISNGARTVSQIRHESKHMQYDLLIIDYLQLLIPESNYRGNRYAEVGEISHALKALAMDFNIPVIALSQLNRVSATQGKDNRPPTMAEMRESGDIEQDASIILLLWNKTDDGTLKGCKVEKNRQGKFGELELKYNGALMSFSDMSGYTPTGNDNQFQNDVDVYDVMPWDM